MISCSSCWNSQRQKDGAVMLREILGLGFEWVELGHGTRLSLMDGILQVFEKGGVRFSSLHNFCPLPVEITRPAPDCYQFSSHRTAERERAMLLSRQTIDFAHRFGARVVVMHLGSVPMGGVTKQLIELAKSGRQFTREYTRLKLAAVRAREEKSAFYIKRVKECLLPLVDYAGEKGVCLGIEGRFAYDEIPTEREALALIEEINAPHVGYWHDFGHIQVKHNLGFLDHFEWLSTIRHRLLGCHLHDTEWPAGDHRAPFTGGIEYDRLIPLLPADTLFVWEMSPRRTAEEITTSLAAWKEKFGG
jgi:sugar phosphate isomerase/epimerase